MGGRPIWLAQCCPTSEPSLLMCKDSPFIMRHKNIQPPLVTHLPTLSEGSEGGLRVLVPLCGKAGCLTHLHKAGHDVIGEL